MKPYDRSLAGAMALAFALAPGLALAFSSGSTGTDGAFTPTVNTEVQLPPSGIFNYTSVNIPVGVTVTYKKNSANTPVVILASGDVTIAGTLDLRGKNAPGVGAGGDGNQGDDGQPGAGGPGGFDGGKGGGALANFTFGGAGVGPGGGSPGFFIPPPIPPATTNCINNSQGFTTGGAGGGFGAAATSVSFPGNTPTVSCNGGGQFTFTLSVPGGAGYGSSLLQPLIGGSGGGGGAGYSTFDGGGGGGGGGAIVMAASGTVTVTGSLLADGGKGGDTAGGGAGGAGGGGSGGAIRIIATTIAGNGPISGQSGAAGANGPGLTGSVFSATAGAPGRIRLEADTITRTAATTPLATSDVPGNIFLANVPTLTIARVAGVTAPANPTGSADITLPASTTNPVTVEFATVNVPVGNTVRLTVSPQNGSPTSVVSPAITGSTANGVASVPVNLPVGPSVLQAQTTFTIVAAVGDLLRYYAGNEQVEQIELSAIFGGPSSVTLVTVSGKRYEVPQALLAALGM